MICPRPDRPLFFPPQAPTHLELTATLTLPRGTLGLVVLVESEGRHAPRALTEAVAASLRTAGIATCLVDLLDPSEAQDTVKRRDIDLLTDRLERVVDFLSLDARTWQLPLGLLGTGRAAAAVLTLAAERPQLIRTAISCCGRPDLALVNFSQLSVPTLLIAPGKNRRLVQASEHVFLELRCPSQLAIVRGASQQLTENDTATACEQVIRKWCRRHVRRSAPPRREDHETRPNHEVFKGGAEGL